MEKKGAYSAHGPECIFVRAEFYIRFARGPSLFVTDADAYGMQRSEELLKRKADK